VPAGRCRGPSRGSARTGPAIAAAGRKAAETTHRLGQNQARGRDIEDLQGRAAEELVREHKTSSTSYLGMETKGRR